MSIYNLKYLLNPKSVVLIGASNRASSIGAVLVQNLLSSGYAGPIMLINPQYEPIDAKQCYPDVASLPTIPELAVIATTPASVLALITELGMRGTKAVIIISAGFDTLDEPYAKAMQKAIIDVAQQYNIRIIGPNCLGILLPQIGLNASFSPIKPAKGKLAFVSQSGAVLISVLDWAASRNIGFSHLVSLGNMADVDFGDMLDYLANDKHTSAIFLYIEDITSARKFMSAARLAARVKPVLVLKAGRYSDDTQTAVSHTGKLVSEDAIYDAVFCRAGILRIFSLEEMFEALETLSIAKPPRGNRMAILTNGRGLGVLTADALIDQGGQLASLSSETIEKLNQVLPPIWSHRNPVDIIGDATGDRYSSAIQILNQDSNIDAILVLNCPTTIASSVNAAYAVVNNVSRNQKTLLLASWVGEQAVNDARAIFIKHKIPFYETPEQAVTAFMSLVNYRHRQKMLMETPQSIPEDFSIDTNKSRTLIEQVLLEDRYWLTDSESKQLLTAYDIPVVMTTVVHTVKQAMNNAALLGVPVVLKIISPDIHLSDVAGVALNLMGPESVREAAEEMLKKIKESQPQAQLMGFSIEPMLESRHAYELFIGMIEDANFGPVIAFGHGGRAVDVINDKAIGLPPMNMHFARDIISRTKVYKLLKGYHGFPSANLDAIAVTLIKVSQLVIDNPEIAELDINPLRVNASGVVTLGARVKIKKTSEVTVNRLAIRPYPKEMEELIPLGDGRTLLLRPILPEDEPALLAGFANLTPEEVRFRFFAPSQVMSHVTAARFTQIDYDREMALVLTSLGVPGKATIYGVVRIIADADNNSAEYAVIVSHEMTGMGLGILLMRKKK